MHVVPLTGVSFPMGRATGDSGDDLAARYAWQWVPLEIGLGAKFADSFYVGGYLGFSVGAEGSDRSVELQCSDDDANLENNVACSSATVRAGIEARYVFSPGESAAPWIGYGIGYTYASETISDDFGYDETVSLSGIELAHLGVGLDWRLTKGFGLGPFVTGSVGRYTSTRTEINGVETHDGKVDDPAVHVWLSVGLRLVVFP